MLFTIVLIIFEDLIWELLDVSSLTFVYDAIDSFRRFNEPVCLKDMIYPLPNSILSFGARQDKKVCACVCPLHYFWMTKWEK